MNKSSDNQTSQGQARQKSSFHLLLKFNEEQISTETNAPPAIENNTYSNSGLNYENLTSEQRGVSNVIDSLLEDYNVQEIGKRLNQAKNLMQQYANQAQEGNIAHDPRMKEKLAIDAADYETQAQNLQTEQLKEFWPAVNQAFVQINGIDVELGAYMLEDLSEKLRAKGIEDIRFLEALSCPDAIEQNTSARSGVQHLDKNLNKAPQM